MRNLVANNHRDCGCKSNSIKPHHDTARLNGCPDEKPKSCLSEPKHPSKSKQCRFAEAAVVHNIPKGGDHCSNNDKHNHEVERSKTPPAGSRERRIAAMHHIRHVLDQVKDCIEKIKDSDRVTKQMLAQKDLVKRFVETPKAGSHQCPKEHKPGKCHEPVKLLLGETTKADSHHCPKEDKPGKCHEPVKQLLKGEPLSGVNSKGHAFRTCDDCENSGNKDALSGVDSKGRSFRNCDGNENHKKECDKPIKLKLWLRPLGCNKYFVSLKPLKPITNESKRSNKESDGEEDESSSSEESSTTGESSSSEKSSSTGKCCSSENSSSTSKSCSSEKSSASKECSSSGKSTSSNESHCLVFEEPVHQTEEIDSCKKTDDSMANLLQESKNSMEGCEKSVKEITTDKCQPVKEKQKDLCHSSKENLRSTPVSTCSVKTDSTQSCKEIHDQLNDSVCTSPAKKHSELPSKDLRHHNHEECDSFSEDDYGSDVCERFSDSDESDEDPLNSEDENFVEEHAHQEGHQLLSKFSTHLAPFKPGSLDSLPNKRHPEYDECEDDTSSQGFYDEPQSEDSANYHNTADDYLHPNDKFATHQPTCFPI